MIVPSINFEKNKRLSMGSVCQFMSFSGGFGALLLYALGAFSIAIFSPSKSANALEIKRPKLVVELFTSQGCPACPPADRLLGELVQLEDVLGLSVHIDYWDYLGWKDVYASRENSHRQRGYAKVLGQKQVFTPQAVINGKKMKIGSKKAEILSALEEGRKQGEDLNAPITAEASGVFVRISVPPHSGATPASLIAVSYSKEEVVNIQKGQNAGKTFVYHNVVRSMRELGVVKSAGFDMEFKREVLMPQGNHGAILLQEFDKQGNPGKIIGALTLHDASTLN